MFVLSANGAGIVDVTGMDIRTIENTVQYEDGSIGRNIIGYEIVGYGFGYSISLGQYELEQQARDVFKDILVNLKKGKEFYDVQENQSKFMERAR